MSKQSGLNELIEPIVVGMDYELVGVEYLPQGKHSILRIYIDKPEGIDVDDCGEVSRQISAMLDVEDPINGEYSLEVSSPGLDRPLFSLAHFEQFIGRRANVRSKMPIDGQRKFVGVIESLNGDIVNLVTDSKSAAIPFDLIDKANLLPEF
ncbi:MAG: ribosome maturation factor RimP [Gammaproteobacteria bacterium]|nr:ribosome maturation factor RimP [Gammaproteobacteria bacterium]